MRGGACNPAALMSPATSAPCRAAPGHDCGRATRRPFLLAREPEASAPSCERTLTKCLFELPRPPWPQPAPHLSGLLIGNLPTVIELDDSNYAVDVLNCVPAHRLHILSLLDDNLR
jgi:hypothetical protein